jgi:hypothetical protein
MTAYTDFHYSPTGSGVISGAQVLEQTEQGINGLGQYVQDNVSGAIDTANEALTTARNADSNATTAINLANSFNAQIIAANQTAGNALTTAQSAQSTANAASSLATTANNSAATALNTANAASAGVTALTGTVNSLGNRMTAAENAINTNAGNITTLQNNLATTNANVTAAANAASAAQATATSAQSTATLARNQAYVLRYTGTTITGGGTIAYADIDNTDNIKAGDKIIDISGAIYAIASVDTANETVTVGASPVINLFCDAENLIPAANDAYDLGSASKQWLNTYSKGYYYNGVAWGLDQGNAWTGANSFYKSIQIHGGRNAYIMPEFAASYSGLIFGTVEFKQSFKFGDWVDNNSTIGLNTSNAYVEIYAGLDSSDNINKARLNPSPNATTAELGTSTNKWKTLNGVNPGALSLPVTATTDASGDIVPPSGESSINLSGGANTYTPSNNGWLTLAINCASGNCIIVRQNTSNRDTLNYMQGYVPGQSNIYLTLPVLAGVTYYVFLYATSFVMARFALCQGNV